MDSRGGRRGRGLFGTGQRHVGQLEASVGSCDGRSRHHRHGGCHAGCHAAGAEGGAAVGHGSDDELVAGGGAGPAGATHGKGGRRKRDVALARQLLEADVVH